MSFSRPDVARLISEAFIPVALSMHLRGMASDDFGRDFVLKQGVVGAEHIRPPEVVDLYPPDTFVVGPDQRVLGRLGHDASADATIEVLKNVLRESPDLCPAGGPDAFDPKSPSDPAALELRAIALRYDSTTGPYVPGLRPINELALDGNKAALVPELEAWIAEHGGTRSDEDALARVLLGGARYHADDVPGAKSIWQTVLDLYPDHPLRHRAQYFLIEPGCFPAMPHPDLASAPPPSIAKLGVVVPDVKARERHLALVRDDPRYIALRSGLPFVRVPAGSFTMGGTPAVQARELPTRQVTISKPFLISAWPVTRALWHLFREDEFPLDEHEGLAGELPATKIAWTDAAAFCDFLSGIDGRSYRLPTEAEWEYAARGGLEGKAYPWGDEPIDPTRCNYLNPRPVPVGCYAPNAYGLFDCVGNSFEWVADYYLKDAYARTATEVVDPLGPTEEMLPVVDRNGGQARGMAHVARGGGFLGNPMCSINCRNSWRLGFAESFRWINTSFRIVTDL